MDLPPIQPPPPPFQPTQVVSGRRRWGGGLSVAVVLVLILPVALAWSLYTTLHLSSDVDVFRRMALAESGVSWDRQVEARLTGASCSLVRWGLDAAPLPREASIAIEALRGAQVAVYRPKHSSGTASPGTADHGLSVPRGWDRVVAVVQDGQEVQVYTRPAGWRGRDLEACVVVRNAEHLVVAAVRTRPDRLLELLPEPRPWKHRQRESRFREWTGIPNLPAPQDAWR